MKKKNIITIAILLSLVSIFSLEAQRTKSSQSAGEQVYAEKGLKDNRYFFYFINSSISNLGNDEEKKIYKEAIQRDIIAQMLYLKFMFHDSFMEIKHAQKLLIKLYKITLKKDILITKRLLNKFAPAVIRSEDNAARRYLKLGYRDVTEAKTNMIMADHYRRRLYSLRLYKYVKAIKKAKHGKRYAFYAKLQTISRQDEINRLNNIVKKQRSNLYTIKEDNEELKIARKNLRAAKENYRLSKLSLGRLNFDRLEQFISKISQNRKDYYTLLHYDNYYKTVDGKTFYDSIWENPSLNDIKEFEVYLKKD